MASTDVQVVRAVFDAFEARDVERMLEFTHPDLEFIAQTNDLTGRTGPYRGHEGMRQYFSDVARVWDELRLFPDEFREIEGGVLVLGRVSARSPARIVAGSTGWVWRLREGKVVYGRVYGSAGEAEASVKG
jgi:ketosteroid isomerase-like protein